MDALALNGLSLLFKPAVGKRWHGHAVVEELLIGFVVFFAYLSLK
jgi:hypothetical protein